MSWHRGVVAHPYEKRPSIYLSQLGLSPAPLASPSFTLRMTQSKTKHDNINGAQGTGSEEGDAPAHCMPGRISMCQPPSERHPCPAPGCGTGEGSL